MIRIEVCAGSVRDCLVAQTEGASRIELVSAPYLGGLTPTVSLLDIVLENGVFIPIVCMVRPRGGGFHYTDIEKEQMFREAKELLKHGASGIVFGFLTDDKKIDWQATEKMIELCDKYGAESIFHRAFDVAKHPEQNLQRLVGLGCTRVLTSGMAETAEKGVQMLKYFQEKYGRHIEILAGSGITESNFLAILEQSGVEQLHGTFKKWETDSTTSGDKVSFSYSEKGDYEAVDSDIIDKIMEKVNEINFKLENSEESV